MEHGKYIIMKIDGREIAICFNPIVNHCDIGTKGGSRGEVIAAGFFAVSADIKEWENGELSANSPNDPMNIDISCFGESISLNIKSRKEVDAALILPVLRKQY